MNADDQELESLLSAKNRRITLPDRVFEISQPIKIQRSKQDIFAYGTTIALTKYFPDGNPILEVSGSPTQRKSRVRIFGLDIEGDGRKVTGIYSKTTFRFVLDDCNVNNIDGRALHVEDAFDFVARYSDFRNCGNRDLSQETVYLKGQPAPIPGLPPNHTSMNTVTLNDCVVERYYGIGIAAYNQTVLRIRDTKIHGTEDPRGVSVGGIKVSGSNRVRLTVTHHVLGRDFDISVVDSKDVQTVGQITPLGKSLKLLTVNSSVASSVYTKVSE